MSVFEQAVLSVAAAGALLAAAPGGAAGVRQDFEWTGRVEAGDAVEVKGISGDIRAVSHDGSDVVVIATKHGRSRDLDLVTFEVTEHGGGVTVCAMYPPSRRGRSYECEAGGWHGLDIDDVDVDVTFEVRVPRGVEFVGRTITGDIEVEDLEAEVVARTISGDIEVSTADIAEASSVSGSIWVRMGRNDWRGDLEFSTVSGDVVVNVPEGLNADVEFAALTGDLETDFRMTMSGRTFIRHQLRGTIGSGGRGLVLKTVSGDVRLRRAT